MGANVLIVEDQQGLKEMISATLLAYGHHPICVGDTETAGLILSSAIPDLVLVDCALPGLSSIQFAQGLRAASHTSTVPLIMLTTPEITAEDCAKAIAPGAAMYLTKPVGRRDLIIRISASLSPIAREADYEPRIAGPLSLDPVTHRASVAGRELPLAPTEFRLLDYLISYPEQIFSRSELVEALWRDRDRVAQRTIDVAVRRLRGAFSLAGHHWMIQTVRGAGYRLSAIREQEDLTLSGDGRSPGRVSTRNSAN